MLDGGGDASALGTADVGEMVVLENTAGSVDEGGEWGVIGKQPGLRINWRGEGGLEVGGEELGEEVG